VNPADFTDVRGMPDVVNATVDALVHGRNILYVGPPGIGKTMVARRIPSIMPALEEFDQGVISERYRRFGLATDNRVCNAPFRAPHNSVSDAGLIGSSGRCGELHLAEFGVLFLDELVEFRRVAIEKLSVEMRNVKVHLVASANPCMCGWHGYKEHDCFCSDKSLASYKARLDWFVDKLGLSDGVIRMPAVKHMDFGKLPPGEASRDIRVRMNAAKAP